MEQERISPQLVLSILGVEQIMNEPFSISQMKKFAMQKINQLIK
jgi:hypothetical protein